MPIFAHKLTSFKIISSWQSLRSGIVGLKGMNILKVLRKLSLLKYAHHQGTWHCLSHCSLISTAVFTKCIFQFDKPFPSKDTLHPIAVSVCIFMILVRQNTFNNHMYFLYYRILLTSFLIKKKMGSPCFLIDMSSELGWSLHLSCVVMFLLVGCLFIYDCES